MANSERRMANWREAVSRVNDRKGFTLVEVVIILVVLSILAAVAVPMALRIFERTAEDATREEMANLKKALIGDPQKLQSTFRSDFGFLGDIGRLPTAAENLDALVTQGSFLPFAFNDPKQTGAGWKGPYIVGATSGQELEEFKKDQWGVAYVYDDTDYVNANSQNVDAKITSAGPDGSMIATADNIILEILKNEVFGTARGTVKNSSGVALASVPVEFYSADNGTLPASPPTATTDANGNYSFSSVPFGARAVKPNATLVLVPGSVTVSGGGNRNVEFDVRNYSGSSVQVTSLNVVTCPGAVRYDDIEFDNSNVESPNSGNRPCNSNINLDLGDPNTSFSANPTPPSSLRVIVDSPDTQLPDFTLRGGGTTRHIELIRFEDGGGNPVDMSGKTLTVTFNLVVGGSATMTVVTP